MPIKKGDNQIKDVQTEKRIHEHLNNEKDIISEDDIRNAKTDIASEEAIISDVTDNERVNDERQGKNTDSSDDPGIQTSWNILDNN